MKNRALFFRSTWRHAAMHPGRCAHRAAKVVPRNDKGAVFLGVDNFCVGLHVCEFACLTVVLCALSRCPAPATQPAVTPPETQAAGQRCTWCRMRNCSVLAAGARTRRARRTPCWQGARHMHDLASFSMAKESPFDFALACLDRLLGRAACLEAKLHSHTPPSSRSTTNSPCRASVAVWLTEMGCPGKNQRIRACSPPAASPLPALAEAPAGNAARQHGRLDTAVHERAAGCPATSVPRTARPSGSAMFSRRTAVMRQASCRRHPAQAGSIFAPRLATNCPIPFFVNAWSTTDFPDDDHSGVTGPRWPGPVRCEVGRTRGAPRARVQRAASACLRRAGGGEAVCVQRTTFDGCTRSLWWNQEGTLRLIDHLTGAITSNRLVVSEAGGDVIACLASE